MLAIIRLLLPDVLLPATTALGTIISNRKRKGRLRRVQMLLCLIYHQLNVRSKYSLYDGKNVQDIEVLNIEK